MDDDQLHKAVRHALAAAQDAPKSDWGFTLPPTGVDGGVLVTADDGTQWTVTVTLVK